MISLFASGLSVLDVTEQEISSDIIATTNYPISLLHKNINSHFHFAMDIQTITWWNSHCNKSTKFISSQCIYLNKSDGLPHAFDLVDPGVFHPFSSTTFMIALQWLIKEFPKEHIKIYGLDFVIPDNPLLLIKWYDKFIVECNEFGEPKFTKNTYNNRMINKPDSFKELFLKWYSLNKNKDLSFHGVFKP